MTKEMIVVDPYNCPFRPLGISKKAEILFTHDDNFSLIFFSHGKRVIYKPNSLSVTRERYAYLFFMT